MTALGPIDGTIDDFLTHIDFVQSMRNDWEKNRERCGSYARRILNGKEAETCSSFFNCSVLCKKESCPILWE